MAYKIIGTIHKIGETETKQGRNGSSFQRRQLIIMQRRFDRMSGEEFEPYYPTLEFGNQHCADLDRYKVGDAVQVMFEIVGMKYNDKSTGEEKYMNSLRAFRIEPYVRQNHPTDLPPQPQQHTVQGSGGFVPNPTGYQQQPAQGYQQALTQKMPQQQQMPFGSEQPPF